MLSQRALPACLLLFLLLFSSNLQAQRGYAPMIVLQVPPDDTVRWYAGVPLRIAVLTNAPLLYAERLKLELRYRENGQSAYVLELNIANETSEGTAIPIRLCAGTESLKTCDQFYITAFQPRLRLASLSDWQGARARAGGYYDPSTHWESTRMPESWYQTRVWINRIPVLDRSGTRFGSDVLSEEDLNKLSVVPGAQIRTVVYFKPAGTAVESHWVPLLDTDTSQPAVIHPCNGVSVDTNGWSVFYERYKRERGSVDADMRIRVRVEGSYGVGELQRVVLDTLPEDSALRVIIETPPGDILYWYRGVPLRVTVIATSGATVYAPGRPVPLDSLHGMTRYSFTLPMKGDTLKIVESGPLRFCIVSGSRRACNEMTVEALWPRLTSTKRGIPWNGCRVRVGEVYDPGTSWLENIFPESWYQTRVWFDGRLVFDASGTAPKASLTEDELRRLTVPGRVKVRTAVYFRPYGTTDETIWTPLLDTGRPWDGLEFPCRGVEVVDAE